MRSKKTHTPDSKQKVLAYIGTRKHPASISDVAGAVGITEKAASIQLYRLVGDGEITKPERGKFLPKSGRVVKAVATAASPTGGTLQALQVKMAELLRERSEIDAKVSALRTSMQLLGHKPRKSRGPITDAQWAEIGQKMEKTK